MTAGTTSLLLRPSPTSRGLFPSARQLAHAHYTPAAATLGSLAGTMFQKANQAYKHAAPAAPPPQRPALAKQLFPSSSPSSSSADIRDQFKNPTSSRPMTSYASAREAQNRPNPLENRSVNLTNAGNRVIPGQGSLSSLYAANSGSFQSKTDCIDLTSIDAAPGKIHEPVFFAEDDFSDDADLDLDFEPPSALPRQEKTPFKENVPEHVPESLKLSPKEAPIPWSSSPASHLRPPNRDSMVSSSREAPPLLQKRESSDDASFSEVPAQKKSKKRVLPWAKQEPDPEHEMDALKTPAPKPRAQWDTSASAIKEQMKQLKNQRASRETDAVIVGEKTHVVEEQAHSPAAAIHLTGEQEYVVDMVVNKGLSVFFTGPAGAGKSVLMRAIITQLKQKYNRDPERVAVTASTGLAACNIGGVTLHSFSGIGLGKDDAHVLVKKIKRNPKAKTRWQRTKCLIIDEISMVDGDLFDKLSHVGRILRNNGRPWGGIQLIITGDFFQLPPVPDSEKRESKFAFDAATWSTSIDHTIGLTQIFRQRDPEFARMLNEIRVGKISPDTVAAFKALSRPLKFDDGVDLAELYPTRAQVEGSNEKKLRELPGKPYRYEAIDSGDPNVRDRLLTNMMAPKALELKVGAQVMLIKNLDSTLVNGSLGKVIAFSDERTFDMGGPPVGLDSELEDSMDKARRKLAATFSRESSSKGTARQYPVVQFISTGGTPRVLLCQLEEWKVELPNGEVQAKRAQLPLILAWSISIHKAQGQTLERVTVDLGRVFEKGQAYVALSRATTQHGLRVVGFEQAKVMAHPKVIEFYSKLSSVADAAKNRPTTIADFILNKKGVLGRPGASKTAAIVPRPIALDDEEKAMASYGH